MKKLCFVTTIGDTLENFIIPSLPLFKNDGYDITLIADMTDGFIQKYSSEYHCINVRMKRGVHISDMLVKPFEFYHIFKNKQFDYVQYATTNASLYASVAAWAAKIPHRVCCLWGICFYTKNGIYKFAMKIFERFPCIFSTHISVPSKKNQLIGANYGLYKYENSSVVGDGGTVGVNLSVFDIRKREMFRKIVLQDYPQLKGKFVYGFLGRICEDKGVNELLHAFLSMDSDNIALLLIGPLDTTVKGIKKELYEKAKQKPNVVFTGYTKDVPNYLSIVDVLVHPSYHEGFSMAIQQAMAMGCAIITTNIPGPSEIIEKDISGILVEPNNSMELKDAMIIMQSNVHKFKSMKEEGYKRVVACFSMDRMVQLTYENRLSIINL